MSLVIRWCQRIECLSRVCTVFLALFVEFKMGKHKKKNRTAFSFSEHLYSSEKATATIVCSENTTVTFVSSQIGDRWIGK